jgi:serine/threonine-protein kinase
MIDQLDRLVSALADRYAIERELGAGGMATVYLARDVKHDRKVAVKVLRPELAAALGTDRFLREIKIAAQLQHPHILPLHDSGEADSFLFYVMPFVDGESLRDKLNREKQLSVDDALTIATQVADALGSAHRQGIVHRDIKPENILLRESHAVVADFGIAVAVTAAGGERLTETGLSLGTPSYMSPEQVAGDREIDARSDIYSLACVLYEMLAGDPPFVASTPQAVLAKQVTDTAPPITTVRSSIDSRVADAIHTALGKAPADRFESARAFADALREDVARTEPQAKSIVVLPFDNLSPDPDNAFFADGLTEEIIADLSKIRAVRVISRTSAMAFKGTTKTVPQIAGELNERYVLEGSVRRAGNSLRITAQLIDAADDMHLWAEKYGGTVDDVFDLQEQISRRIVEALQVTLAPEEEKRLAARSTSDPRAYEAWLKAMHEARRFSADGVERTLRIANETLGSVGEDPLLYSAISYACYVADDCGFRHDEETLLRAEEAAARALELDPEHSQATLTMGLVHYKRGDWKGFWRQARRAVELEQNADTLAYWAFALMEAGKNEEARYPADEALARDPLNPWAILVRAWTDWPDYEACYVRIRDAAERIAPDVPIVVWWAGTAAAFAGREDEATAWLDRTVKMEAGIFSDLAELLRRSLARDDSGMRELLDTAGLREMAKTDEYFSFYLAFCLAQIGDIDEALEWIRHAIEWGLSGFQLLEANPLLEPLRSDPRFEALMNRARKQAEEIEI